MAGKIFVNYRRSDDPGFTQALYRLLKDEFAADDLFMDGEGRIKPGDDFVAVLNAQVEVTDVTLAVIGPRWRAPGVKFLRATRPTRTLSQRREFNSAGTNSRALLDWLARGRTRWEE